MGWPEDYDLVLRLLEAGHEIGVVPRRLVCWRDHPRRLTHNDDAYRIERFTDAKAHFLVRGFLADTQRYVLWGYGHTGRALRRALAKLGRHPTHVVELHPGRLGQTIHGAPVVPPEALASLPRSRLVASVAGRGTDPDPRASTRARLPRAARLRLRRVSAGDAGKFRLATGVLRRLARSEPSSSAWRSRPAHDRQPHSEREAFP